MDMFNPPPPPGSNPGRYFYTEYSAAPVWIEYSWRQRIPWLTILAALGVIVTILGKIVTILAILIG